MFVKSRNQSFSCKVLLLFDLAELFALKCKTLVEIKCVWAARLRVCLFMQAEKVASCWGNLHKLSFVMLRILDSFGVHQSPGFCVV